VGLLSMGPLYGTVCYHPCATSPVTEYLQTYSCKCIYLRNDKHFTTPL